MTRDPAGWQSEPMTAIHSLGNDDQIGQKLIQLPERKAGGIPGEQVAAGKVDAAIPRLSLSAEFSRQLLHQLRNKHGQVLRRNLLVAVSGFVDGGGCHCLILQNSGALRNGESSCAETPSPPK